MAAVVLRVEVNGRLEPSNVVALSAGQRQFLADYGAQLALEGGAETGPGTVSEAAVILTVLDEAAEDWRAEDEQDGEGGGDDDAGKSAHQEEAPREKPKK